MASACAEERKPVSYKLKKGELEAPDTPAGSPEREPGEEPGSQDDSDSPVRQDASEGDSGAEEAPDATNEKAGIKVSRLSQHGQASVSDAAIWTLNGFREHIRRCTCILPRSSAGMQASAGQVRARADATQHDQDMGRADAKRSRGTAAEEQPPTPSKRSRTEPAPAGKRQVCRASHHDPRQRSCKRPGWDHLSSRAAPGCRHGKTCVMLLGLPRHAAACVKPLYPTATSRLSPCSPGRHVDTAS